MKRREELEKRLLPRSLSLSLEIRRDRKAIESLGRLACDPSALRPESSMRISEWLSPDSAPEWQQVMATYPSAQFGTRSGATNPGDQRALYYIARALRPRSVLEVGTHVGASTSMLSLALRQQIQEGVRSAPRLTTVDIADVNAPDAAWKRVGCQVRPADLLRQIGVADMVTFVTQPSVPYLLNCKERYDLIFLDGNHASTAVYQEIPAALRLLSPDGLILLHDYFPDQQPLWPDHEVVAGPDLAVKRLQDEGVPLIVKPLGGLPWPTKQGTNVTSLAMLCRRG
jgi:predicted O-methyltransferase YrrM